MFICHSLTDSFIIFPSHITFSLSIFVLASFYGLSYIKLPLQETKNSTELELRFKTHQSNGFLFLAAGSPDYCLLYLENGQVAVKINFGTGETYISSDDLELNDLQWHQVRLNIIKSHLSLTIDEKHNYLQRINSDSHDLQIRFGLFLGGQDTNFKSIYLGNLPSFRGCLDQVLFNHKNLLTDYDSRSNVIYHNVDIDVCDEQFTASSNSSISFVKFDSFMMTNGFNGHDSKINLTKLIIQFELKTISQTAILLFSSTTSPYKRQFVSLELINGQLKYVINDGTVEYQLKSSHSINDGRWHLIEIQAIGQDNNRQQRLYIRIDGQEQSTSTEINGKKLFASLSQHSNQLLFGGLNLAKLSLAVNYRLESILLEPNVSLKGCLRNIVVNEKAIGLKDALATNQIQTGKCRWHFLCSPFGERDKNPCIDQSDCLQYDVNQIVCQCERDNCVRPQFKHKTIVARSETIVQCKHWVKPLQVMDGSVAHWDRSLFPNIVQQRDHSRDVKEQQSRWFQTWKLPSYGLLNKAKTRYNWNELINGSIQYKPNRSKNGYNDSLILRFVDSNDSNITKCDHSLLMLPIEIGSSNDAPINNKIITNYRPEIVKLRMAKNSKKLLTSLQRTRVKMIKPTSKRDDQIHYRLLTMTNAGKSYFERTNKPNVPIKDFSELDLKNQVIRFVHLADSTTIDINRPLEISLHVQSTDGTVIDRDLRLSIETYEIELTQIVNTGLLLAHRTSTIVANANLSFTIGNEIGQSQLIRYEIVSGPTYGIIQKLRSSANQWTNATHFSQRQIDRSKVRYLHLIDRPKHDEVRLRVSFNKQSIRSVTMKIMFVDQLQIIRLGSNCHNLTAQDKDVLIDSFRMSFLTEPVHTPSNSIQITLVSIPICGHLFLVTNSETNRPILQRVSDSFTQNDINEEKLSYVRNSLRSCLDVVEDSFDYKVEILGSNISLVSTFTFYMETSNNKSLKKYELINNKLNVVEGEKIVIDRQSLSFNSANNLDDRVMLMINRQPKYGQLQLLSANHDQVETVSPIQFTKNNIEERRVLYWHDDSEHDSDSFEFAFVQDSSNNTLANGRFLIDVTMKNDNPPTRIVDKPFNVIRNDRKPLLDSDLKYVDIDLGTSPSDIMYTVTNTPNGRFQFINATIAEKFTQLNIDRGEIIFQHDGRDTGKAVLWVTDGQGYLSCGLEIRASDPYINLANNTGISVKYGENILITPNSLSIDTNLNLFNRSQDVVFKIISEPRFGQILVNEKVATSFTLEDIYSEMLEYESTVFEDELPLSKNDSFSFRIILNNYNFVSSKLNAFTGGKTHEFAIRIYPQLYFNLNLNVNNVTVFQEKSITLNSSYLFVEHVELKPDQIIYRLIEKPKFGQIIIENVQTLTDMAKRQSLSFTQKDINDGFVVYRNEKLNSTDLYSRFWDHFSFDVGDEVVHLQNQTIFIEIIPKLITIFVTTNVTVEEGHSVILTNQHISINQPYYQQYVDEFIVVEEPKFGKIVSENVGGVQLSAKSFTLKQLKSGKILYKQDSSEVDQDWFTVVARSNELDKESLPATIHIMINSINDEPPKIVNNTETFVWQNEMVQITNTNLAAIDEDTMSSLIQYQTYHATNGYLINGDSNTTVDSFTQDDIDSGRIYFVHVGGIDDASFRFHVTDGVNNGMASLFQIKVRRRKMAIAVNEKLLVVPGMAQSITRHHLQVATNDELNEIGNFSRQYVFRVVKSPSYGRLVLENWNQSFDSDEKVLNFTQEQIDRNLVLYEQTTPISTPTVTDRIILNVESDGLDSLENVHFLVEIVFDSLKQTITDDVSKLIGQIGPLTVEEGKFSQIGTDQVNLSQLMEQASTTNICLRIQVKPSNGFILKSGVAIASSDECIQVGAFTNGSIVYQHDDSDTFNDTVSFELLTAMGPRLAMSIANLSIPILIQPVNDEFPVVLNRNPIIRITPGSKTVVGNEILNSFDNDKLSSIIYQIRMGNRSMSLNIERQQSYFMIKPREFPITEFTQDDIDHNRVMFNHKGTESELIYWFRVKDHPEIKCDNEDIDLVMGNFYEQVAITQRGHCSPYYPLKILVNPLSLQLVNYSTIRLVQGTFSVGITELDLAATSISVGPSSIRFKINRGPFHGYLCVVSSQYGIGSSDELERERIFQFTQQQLNDRLIRYVQTNNSADDYFIVDIENDNDVNEKSIHDVQVKIAVQPLIKAMKPFLVANAGQLSLLSYDYLDASELSLQSNSNPLFTIMNTPKHGHFRMMYFGERIEPIPESPNQITQFTHEDIVRNRIAYVANSNLDLIYPNEMAIDVINYELSAIGVQDAHGILVVNIFGTNTNRTQLEEMGKTETYLDRIDIRLSRDTLLYIFIFVISLLSLGCILIIIRVTLGTCRIGHDRSSTRHHSTCSEHRSTSKSSISSRDDNIMADRCGESSRTSSNSVLTCHSTGRQPHSHHHHPHHHHNQLPLSVNSNPYFNHYNENCNDCNQNPNRTQSSDLLPMFGSQCDKSEDQISPLPPPSLYFINDNSFDADDRHHQHHQPSSSEAMFWRKNIGSRFEDDVECTSPKPLKDHNARSSGDGTSSHHSNSSPSLPIDLNWSCKAKFDQLTHLEDYLRNIGDNLERDDHACTNTVTTITTENNLSRNNNNQVSQSTKPSNTLMRNQYWI